MGRQGLLDIMDFAEKVVKVNQKYTEGSLKSKAAMDQISDLVDEYAAKDSDRHEGS